MPTASCTTTCPQWTTTTLRRGQPTVHCKWDEATAILAGDALQSSRLRALSRARAAIRTPRCDADLALSSGAGPPARRAWCSVRRSTSRRRPRTGPSTSRHHALQSGKTGALITWAGEAGARLAQADPVAAADLRATRSGWRSRSPTTCSTSKATRPRWARPSRKDEAADKATFVSLLGVDGAKRRASELVDTACAALSGFGEDAEGLKQAARFAIARRT